MGGLMNTRVNTQVEDIIGAWTRFQGQWWDGLFGIGKGNVGQPWEQFFSRPLDVSEDVVNCMLQQQSDCIRIAMKNVRPGSGAPRVASEWADQVEKAAQHWVDAQRQAWKTWFAAVRQMDPNHVQGGSKNKSESHADNVFNAWQQATQETLQAQVDSMSRLASGGAKVGEEIVQSSKMAGSKGAQAALNTAGSARGAAAKSAESRRGNA
jgi:hypothetical protein